MDLEGLRRDDMAAMATACLAIAAFNESTAVKHL
jgi:hypothetical protein